MLAGRTADPLCFATSHNTHFHRLPTLRLPAIKLLFFVLNNSIILIVKISFGFDVGDYFVLYEFDWSDLGCEKSWGIPVLGGF